MYYPEELGAMVLTTVLGLAFILRPAIIYEYGIYLFYSGDTGRGGRWGEDPEPSDRALLAIRVIGLVFLLVALVVAVWPWLD